MNDDALFDDQQSPDDLPRWATITQVGHFLAIPRSVVRSAVRHAAAQTEPWVKKEMGQDGNVFYLIDTHHDRYTSQQEQWRNHQTMQSSLAYDAFADWSRSRQVHQENPVPAYSASSDARSSWQAYETSSMGLHGWPQLRQWLFLLGIEIFVNILAEEGPADQWQWRWNELHGEGYIRQEEAIIAALQSRFSFAEDRSKDLASMDLCFSQPPVEQKTQRFKLFARKNASPPSSIEW